MSRSVLKATIFGPEHRRLFVVCRHPTGRRRGCVMLVPPFAEEMNKTRRQFAEVSVALADVGFSAVLVDLFGTGDSGGEFEEGRWRGWQEDVVTAAKWCADEGTPVTAMCAARLGCALGASAVRSAGLVLQSTVFWQPVVEGSRYLAQFLRLRLAASLMGEEGRETVADLRAKLAAGKSLDVAGYALSAALARDLESVSLGDELGPHLGRLHWVEIGRDPDAPLPEPARATLERASAYGLATATHRIAGEPFWSSTEIVVNPALVETTIRALADAS